MKHQVPDRFIPKNYRRCSISLMDNIADPDIGFDENGICNYYYQYKTAEKSSLLTGVERELALESTLKDIKTQGRTRPYDCILGVSGGVDSTYLALKAKEFGLRVLCVHFDNGWNSELAVSNIENIVNKLGFELYTYVINWPEFKDIQLAYFKANVVDIEAVTDIAIFSALDKICKSRKVKYIIDGRNVVTEEVLPKSWINKDVENLKDIHKRYGKLKLRSYPLISYSTRKLNQISSPFKSVPLLNYIDYYKSGAKREIIDKLDWRDYGGKHYESIFTRFYQGYILPNKFGIDKRKAHLSNLIFSGQIDLNEAEAELATPIYPQKLLQEDKVFVLKKLGYSERDFEDYINAPPVSHNNFAEAKPIYEKYPIMNFIKPAANKIFR